MKKILLLLVVLLLAVACSSDKEEENVVKTVIEKIEVKSDGEIKFDYLLDYNELGNISKVEKSSYGIGDSVNGLEYSYDNNGSIVNIKEYSDAGKINLIVESSYEIDYSKNKIRKLVSLDGVDFKKEFDVTFKSLNDLKVISSKIENLKILEERYIVASETSMILSSFEKLYYYRENGITKFDIDSYITKYEEYDSEGVEKSYIREVGEYGVEDELYGKPEFKRFVYSYSDDGKKISENRAEILNPDEILDGFEKYYEYSITSGGHKRVLEETDESGEVIEPIWEVSFGDDYIDDLVLEELYSDENELIFDGITYYQSGEIKTIDNYSFDTLGRVIEKLEEDYKYVYSFGSNGETSKFDIVDLDESDMMEITKSYKKVEISKR